MTRLREIEAADLPVINGWRHDRAVIDRLGNNFLFIAAAIDEAWYRDYLATRPQDVRLAILPDDSDQPIGMVNLTNCHRINRSAEFSVLIGDPASWSQGHGTVATRAMLHHGFIDLNLHRIHLTVLRDNDRAANLYKRVGFQAEGVSRQAVFKNGAYADLVQMAILRQEYLTGLGRPHD